MGITNYKPVSVLIMYLVGFGIAGVVLYFIFVKDYAQRAAKEDVDEIVSVKSGN